MKKTYHLPNDTTAYNLCNMMLKTSHILIAGSTGSGKSVLIDDIIYSVIGWNFPFENDENSARLVLIDPKKVSLIKYRKLPHVIDYATENDEIIKTLKNVIDIMMDRYTIMQNKGEVLYHGSKIVVVIDELADLMTTCKKQVMPLLQRIAQLGRAAKIQLIAATQCPKREIIPAQLTVNFTGRVALRCNSSIESRQIINTAGAETLPKYGEALYLHDDGEIHHVIVPYTPDEKINERITEWTSQYKTQKNIKIKKVFTFINKAFKKIGEACAFVLLLIPSILPSLLFIALMLYLLYKTCL